MGTAAVSPIPGIGCCPDFLVFLANWGSQHSRADWELEFLPSSPSPRPGGLKGSHTMVVVEAGDLVEVTGGKHCGALGRVESATPKTANVVMDEGGRTVRVKLCQLVKKEQSARSHTGTPPPLATA